MIKQALCDYLRSTGLQTSEIPCRVLPNGVSLEYATAVWHDDFCDRQVDLYFYDDILRVGWYYDDSDIRVKPLYKRQVTTLIEYADPNFLDKLAEVIKPLYGD